METDRRPDEIEKKPGREGKKRAILKLAAIVLLLSIALFFYRDSLEDILGGLKGVTGAQLGMAIMLSALGYLLEGLTISCTMQAAGKRKGTAGYGIFTALAGEFYRLATLGNGSGIAKIHFLHRRGIEAGNAAGLVMIQYVWKKIAIVVSGCMGYAILSRRENTRALCREYAVFLAVGSVLALGVAAVLLCLILSDHVKKGLEFILDRIEAKWPFFRKWTSRWREQIAILHNAGRDVLEQKGRMLELFFLQMGKCILFYCIPAFLLRGRSRLAPGENILLMSIAYMLAGVIPAPSGIGSLEFVFFLFFTRFSDQAAAVSAILIFRFATWLLPFAAGAVLVAGQKLVS